MKKIIFLAVVIMLTPFLFCSLVEAERGPASQVEPVIYKEIKFIAPNTPEKMGYVEAWDIKTNKKLWELKVYEVKINPQIEADVQWKFITSLYIYGGKLIAVNEAGKRYEVDIAAKKVVKGDDYKKGDVIIQTNKSQYLPKENIEITITNNFDNESRISNQLTVEKLQENTWEEFALLYSNGKAYPRIPPYSYYNYDAPPGLKEHLNLSSGKSLAIVWQQKLTYWDAQTEEQLKTGRYRFRLWANNDYWIDKTKPQAGAGRTDPYALGSRYLSSNEFEIKEEGK